MEIGGDALVNVLVTKLKSGFIVISGPEYTKAQSSVFKAQFVNGQLNGSKLINKSWIADNIWVLPSLIVMKKMSFVTRDVEQKLKSWINLRGVKQSASSVGGASRIKT